MGREAKGAAARRLIMPSGVRRLPPCCRPHRAVPRTVRAFDQVRQLGAHPKGLYGMPACDIKRYGRAAGQAIDEHDELACEVGDLVELRFAGFHRPRRISLYRGSCHRNAIS